MYHEKSQIQYSGYLFAQRQLLGELFKADRDRAKALLKARLPGVQRDVDAIRAPTGWIPKYEDLVSLFHEVFGQPYSREDYIKQFTIRVPENLGKLDRVEEFHRKEVPDAPKVLFQVLAAQRQRLLKVQEQFGEYVAPDALPEANA